MPLAMIKRTSCRGVATTLGKRAPRRPHVADDRLEPRARKRLSRGVPLASYAAGRQLSTL